MPAGTIEKMQTPVRIMFPLFVDMLQNSKMNWDYWVSLMRKHMQRTCMSMGRRWV